MQAADRAVKLWARKGHQCPVFDRDDARQEALLSAWLAGPRASTTAVYRDVVDAMRRLMPGYRHRAHLFVDVPADPDAAADPGADPLRRLMVSRALAAIQAGSARDRRVCELSAQGEKGAAIAQQLGVSAATVSASLGRVRQRLQEHLQ